MLNYARIMPLAQPHQAVWTADVRHTVVQQVLMSHAHRQRQLQLQSTLQCPLQDVQIVTRSVNYLQQRFPGAKAHTGQRLLCMEE